jgi:hypothetical protein
MSRKLSLRKHDQHYRLFKTKGPFEIKSVMQEFTAYNYELAEFSENILYPLGVRACAILNVIYLWVFI